jgi:hypothetical protein
MYVKNKLAPKIKLIKGFLLMYCIHTYSSGSSTGRLCPRATPSCPSSTPSRRSRIIVRNTRALLHHGAMCPAGQLPKAAVAAARLLQRPSSTTLPPPRPAPAAPPRPHSSRATIPATHAGGDGPTPEHATCKQVSRSPKRTRRRTRAGA